MFSLFPDSNLSDISLYFSKEILFRALKPLQFQFGGTILW